MKNKNSLEELLGTTNSKIELENGNDLENLKKLESDLESDSENLKKLESDLENLKKNKKIKNKKKEIKNKKKEIENKKKEIENKKEEIKNKKEELENKNKERLESINKLNDSIETINKYINSFIDKNFRKGKRYENALKSIKLVGFNLSNLNLSNLDLEGSKLIGVVAFRTNFSGSNLKNADLSSFYGIRVSFKKAILSGIKFDTCINNKEDINNEDINKLIPQSARKRNSVITKSDFELADLKGVNLSNVNLEQSIMNQVKVDENTVFNYDTIMEATKIRGIDINKARFNEKINLYNTLMDNEQKNLLASKGINVTNVIVKDIVEPKQELLQETSSQKLEKEENNKKIEQQSQIQQEQTQTQPRIKPELKTHTQKLEESRQAQVTSQINTDGSESDDEKRYKELCERRQNKDGKNLSIKEMLEMNRLEKKLNASQNQLPGK